jgi:hypothetical protein
MMSQKKSNKSVFYVGLFFGILGIVFAGVSFFVSQSTKDFLARAVKTEGQVIRFGTGMKDGSTYYYPVVEFTCNDRPVEFQSTSGSSPAAYDKGEQVEIYYLPDSPTSAKISDWWSLWGMSFIFGLLATVLLLVPVLILLARSFIRKGFISIVDEENTRTG